MYLNLFDRLYVFEFKKNKGMRCICIVVDVCRGRFFFKW